MSPLIDIEVLRDLSAGDPAAVAGGDDEELLVLLECRELLLVKQTIEYLQSFVPYYRDSFKDQGFDPAGFQRLSDLRRVPVLAKATMVPRLEEFLSQMPGLSMNSMVSTSGTTSNIRLPRFISDEELEACSVLSRVRSGRREANPGGDILLRVFPAMRRYMGHPRHADFPTIVVTLALHYPKYTLKSSFDDFVLKQLYDRFPIPGTAGYVTVVHTTPPFLLRMMSEEMQARSQSPQDTHVRAVACTGGFMTNRIRTLIREFWQVPAMTSYSLTEFNGYAPGCALRPNRFHFDESLYAEVVDPVTHEPVAEGEEGLLLVTTLYPFQQAQPFLRYDTGDLVRYNGRLCECGAVGTTIEFVGRSNHCLDLSDILPAGAGMRFLASAEIHDILEDIPEVPSLLYPRFRVERADQEGVTTLTLTAEVHQKTSGAMVARVKEQLLGSILSRFGPLNDLTHSGKLAWEIDLCNRGEMQSYYHLYPDA